MQIIMKKNQFCLFLGVLFSLNMYAGSSLQEANFSWRLDSVIYTDGRGYEIEKLEHVCQYAYDARSLSVVDADRFLWEDTLFLFSPLKTVYTLDVDSGMYLKETFRPKQRVIERPWDSLPYVSYDILWKRELYFKDDYRTIYDESGYEIRKIHNYDYIVYFTEPYDGVTYLPDSRYVMIADDTLATEYIYYYDTLVNMRLSKENRYTYKDHLLASKEYNIKRTYHANGAMASYKSRKELYNTLGVMTNEMQIDISWNENGDTLSVRNWNTSRKDGATNGTLYENADYTYDSVGVLIHKMTEQQLTHRKDTSWRKTLNYSYENGDLVSIKYENRVYDFLSKMNYRWLNYEWANGEWTLKHEAEWIHKPTLTGEKEQTLVLQNTYGENNTGTHIINQYDSLYRLTLAYDSSYTNTQGWVCKRQEYKDGKLILDSHRRKNSAFGGRWYIEYEKRVKDTYYEIIKTNWNSGHVENNGVTVRDTIRWYDRKYNNGFDDISTGELYNSQTNTWRYFHCVKMQTTFDDDGAPISALEYGYTEEGISTVPSYFYTYTYDKNLGLYVRTAVSRFYQDDNGTLKTYDVNFFSQALFTKSGENVGYRESYYDNTVKGHCHRYEYDEMGRKKRSISYMSEGTKDNIGEWKEIGEYRDYFYYPAPHEKVCAYDVEYTIDSVGNKEVKGINKNIKSFNVFDENGIYLEKHVYAWENDTLVCDTIIYNRPTYNAEGQLVENDEWKYIVWNDGKEPTNKPVTLYRYFYRPDGTRRDCYFTANYTDDKELFSITLTNGGLGDILLDDQGRAIEKIYYVIDATNTVLVPSKREVCRYTEEATDWYEQDVYVYNSAEEAWVLDITNYRGISPNTPKMSFDEEGNMIERVTKNDTYYITYGASFEEYPVLCPAAVGVQENLFFNQYTYNTLNHSILNVSELKARPLSVYKKADVQKGPYTTHYFYTPLTENVDSIYKDEGVEIEPTDTTAHITWPEIKGATAYTIIIWADAARTEKICAMHMDSIGNLIEIDFSKMPQRRKAAYMQQSTFQTTVTQLVPQTQYWYTLEAYDSIGLLIHTLFGSFTTTGNTESIEQLYHDSTQNGKVLYNGNLYIKTNDAIYNAEGRRLL